MNFKRHYISLALFSCLGISAFAQNEQKEINPTNNDEISRDALDIKYKIKEVVLGEKTIELNGVKQNGISVDIPEADFSIVKKEWEKAIKKKTKSKITTTKYGLSILNTSINQITEAPLDVFSSVIDTDYGVTVVSVFEIDSVLLTPASSLENYNNAKRFMQDFGTEQYKLSISNNIKEEKKLLKTVEGQLSKYQKENEKLHKSVTNNELNIVNSETEISQNKLEQESILDKIRAQKSVVMSASGDQKKIENGKLKDLEKAKKKLMSNTKSNYNKIVKYKAKIEEAKREIKLNLSNQDLQKTIVDKQLSVVKSVEQKLLNVK